MTKQRTRVNSGPGVSIGEGTSSAAELLAISAGAGIAGMQAAARLPFAELAEHAEAGASDITDELEKGGPAFGALVRAVGLGIADAQKALDENLVATATALSEAEIDVIAVYEQTVSDETGEMATGTPIVQKLPLINYLMPTGYQFRQAKIRSEMYVSEFNSANGFNVQSKSKSVSAGISGGYASRRGFSISGYASYGDSSSEVSGSSSYGQDYAAGKIEMEVTLEPRTDIALPKPLIVQKGPRLSLALESLKYLDATGNEVDADSATKRRAIVRATLRKSNGTPNDAKELSATVDNAALTFAFKNAAGADATETESDGTLRIYVDRAGAAFDTNSTVQAQLDVRFGIAGDSMTLNL